jgi:hypothetical protein
VEANVYGTVKASAAREVTFSNSSLPPSGTKVVTASPATATSLTAQNLYPFTDGYTMYAGSCSANNPSPNAGPFVATPAPGGSATTTIRQAALNVTVTINGAQPGATITNGQVNLYNPTAGCPDYIDIPMLPTGRLADSGFPGGTYDICFDGKQGNSFYKIVKPGIVLNNFTSGTTLNVDTATSTILSGTCGTTAP